MNKRNIGTTTLPITCWLVDRHQPETIRLIHLGVMCQLVNEYTLPSIELTWT
jgi:hypothetical protein